MHLDKETFMSNFKATKNSEPKYEQEFLRQKDI